MDMLELILFRVGHGLSLALIEHPANYVTLVDLGADSGFTPLKYLALIRRLRPDVLYVTHPHADHLADVETALQEHFRPDAIYYHDYDWRDVAAREKPECRWLVTQFQKLIATIPMRRYNGAAELNEWYYPVDIARKHFGDAAYVNASSLFLIYTWKDFKISIASDQESSVAEGYLKTEGFLKEASGTNILIAPHHGHKNGFPCSWPSIIGKPAITLISVQERDPHVHTGYSSAAFASGVPIDGKTRYSLTTRQDGNLFVRMWYENSKPVWSFEQSLSLGAAR